MNRSSSTYRPSASNLTCCPDNPKATISGIFVGCTFAGKEKDLETGLSYFGARYYDADLLTGWLSVDPMADKYPGMSPYSYCAGNPVKLVDPDGREIWIIGGNGNRKLYTPISISGKSRRTGVEGMIDQIYSTKAGKFVIQKLINSDNHYTVTSEKSSISDNPCYNRSTRTIYLNAKKTQPHYATIAHEIFHAFQHDEGIKGHNRANEVEAFLFAGIVMRQAEGKNWHQKMPDGMSSAYNGNDSKKGQCYQKAMFELTATYTPQNMCQAVSLFLSHSLVGEGYRNYNFSPTGDVFYGTKSLLSKYQKQIY